MDLMGKKIAENPFDSNISKMINNLIIENYMYIVMWQGARCFPHRKSLLKSSFMEIA